MHKEFGKIESCKLGSGGYQDAMFGFSFTFSGKSWGTGTFIGTWGMAPGKGASWTTGDQSKIWAENMRNVKDIMKQAKVDSFEKLKGIPVECTFESPNGRLLSWRVLEECL